MSIKRGVFSIFLGIIVEVSVLWGLNRLMAWRLFERINWRSIFVWAFFFGGFFSAVWLYLWTKLLARIFGDKKKNAERSNTIAQPSGVPAHPVVSAPVPSSGNTQVQNTSMSPDKPTTVATPNTQALPSSPTPAVPVRPMAPRMPPPVRMAVQNSAILTIDPSNPATQTPAPTAAPVTPAVSQRTPSQKENDIVELSNIDQELDMMPFKHVALEGKVIDLVYSSDDVAILCKLFSDDHTWSVDTTQPINECVWQNENGETYKPCSTLLSQVVALKKMESEAEIIPTIVMVRGSVQNLQQVQDYLLQNKITLVQYENEKMSEVTSLHTLLKEKFSLFPEEEDDEDDQDVSDEENADLSDTDDGYEGQT